MRQFIKIIKGSLIGIGSILPGISGSMVAAILKVYQALIDALNQITSHPILAIKSVWQYILGIIVGLFFGFLFISYLFDLAPIVITFLFIGFIIGAIPLLYSEVHGTKIKWHHVVVFVLAIAAMISFLLLDGTQTNPTSTLYPFIVIAIGIIYAIALIIPGLSGSTMLLVFGFFHILLDIVSDLGQAVRHLDFAGIVAQLPTLLLLILGTLIGLIGMGKVMHLLYHKYKVHFYITVLGIVIVSPLNILIMLNRDIAGGLSSEPWYTYVISAVLFFIGFIVTFIISTRKPKQREELS